MNSLGQLPYYLVFGIGVVLSLISYESKRGSKFFLILFCLILITFSGLRGGFTTDYPHYVNIYETVGKMSIKEWFTWGPEVYYVEKGFALFCRILYKILPNPIPVFFIITSCFVVCPVFWLIRKRECEHPWFFLFLFLMFGSYYQSFNVIRQAIVASLFVYSYELIRKGCFAKFLLYDFFLASFHITALFMIPVYFYLRIKPGEKKLLLDVVGLGVFLLLYNRIIIIVDKIFFSSHFLRFNDLGSDVNFFGVLGQVLIGLFVLFVFIYSDGAKSFSIQSITSSSYDYSSTVVPESWLLYNGTVLWILCEVLMLATSYFARISLFFSPFAFLGFCKSLDSDIWEDKTLVLFIMGFIFVVFEFYFNIPYDTYFFYWK